MPELIKEDLETRYLPFGDIMFFFKSFIFKG